MPEFGYSGIYYNQSIALLLKCYGHDNLMYEDTFKQDDYSTVGGDGGCRVDEVRAGTTSPMPHHKGFKLQ